jgi:YbgC/YbaW family acyl-CoA thioester hydrolase
VPVVHEEKLRVQWVDTDASGRIHYTAALRYFEVAEHGLMRRLMGGVTPWAQDFGLPRVHVEADYKLALRFQDEITCSARVAHVGNTSASYAYEIRNLAGEVAIVGKIAVVAVDGLGRPMPLPPPLRSALEKGL